MPWSEQASWDPAALLGAAVLALVISALGSLWAIAHARRNGLVDQPGERRSHDNPTPRGGGIGIVVASMVALSLVSMPDAGGGSWLLIGGGLLLVAAIGWWDDHRPLPAWPRLLVHAVAAGCLAWAMRLQGADTAAVVAAFVLAIGLVNAWNFMDGINGLAASQAVLCALGFAVLLDGVWRVLALILAAACLGFLPFNFPRARVFLGDVGSGALGYLVAALLAAGFARYPVTTWPWLLLPPTVMLVDTGLTLSWRIRRGEVWWQAHVQHLFQRWSRREGHAKVALAYALWTAMAVTVMLALQHAPQAWKGTAGLGGGLAACMVWWRMHRTMRV